MDLWGEPKSNQRLKQIHTAIRHPDKYTQLSIRDEMDDALHIRGLIRNGSWQVNPGS